MDKLDPNIMWVNAFKLINPSDELCLEIGKDVVAFLKHSMGREREPLEPIGDVTIRFTAS